MDKIFEGLGALNALVIIVFGLPFILVWVVLTTIFGGGNDK